jgi:hypothetical protein
VRQTHASRNRGLSGLASRVKAGFLPCALSTRLIDRAPTPRVSPGLVSPPPPSWAPIPRRTPPIKDGLRPGRAPRNVDIDRDHLVGTSHHIVSVKPASSACGAGTDGEGKFGIWNRFHQPLERGYDLACHGAANRNYIGMPWRSDKLDAETLSIIIGGENIDSHPLQAPVLAWYTQSAFPNAFLQRLFSRVAPVTFPGTPTRSLHG